MSTNNTDNEGDLSKKIKNKNSKGEVFISKGSIETTEAANERESNSESVPDSF